MTGYTHPNDAPVLIGSIDDVDWDRPESTSWLVDVGDDILWPLHVINGHRPGPTTIISGGVHGDEFEGPALVAELCRTISASALGGRLILLPAVSPSGIAARNRFCPVDQIDPNRSFPGAADGTITHRIAAMMTCSIIPQADIVYDVHAGGTYDAIVPSVMIYPRDDIDQTRVSVEAMAAFNAPAALVVNSCGSETMLDGEVARQGKIFGCVELGSFGSIDVEAMKIGRHGLRNILVHSGMIVGEYSEPALWRGRTPRFFSALESDHDLVAPVSGYFVPNIDIGDYVTAGRLVGELIDLAAPAAPAIPVCAHRGGFVYIRAAGGPVAQGAPLLNIIDEVSGPEEIMARLARS